MDNQTDKKILDESTVMYVNFVKIAEQYRELNRTDTVNRIDNLKEAEKNYSEAIQRADECLWKSRQIEVDCDNIYRDIWNYSVKRAYICNEIAESYENPCNDTKPDYYNYEKHMYYAKAIESCDRVIYEYTLEKQTLKKNAYKIRGDVYNNLHNLDRAIEDYEKAIGCFPADNDFDYALRIALHTIYMIKTDLESTKEHEKEGLLKKAKVYIDATEDEKDQGVVEYFKYYELYVKLLIKQKKFQDAVNKINECVKEIKVSHLVSKFDEYRESLKIFEGKSKRLLGTCYYNLGYHEKSNKKAGEHYDTAIKWLEPYIKGCEEGTIEHAVNDLGDANYCLSKIYYAKSEYSKTKDIIDKVMKKPEDAMNINRFRTLLPELYNYWGEYNKTIDELFLILGDTNKVKDDEEEKNALENLGAYVGESEDTDTDADTDRISMANAYYLRGKALYKLYRYAEARADLIKAVNINKNDNTDKETNKLSIKRLKGIYHEQLAKVYMCLYMDGKGSLENAATAFENGKTIYKARLEPTQYIENKLLEVIGLQAVIEFASYKKMKTVKIQRSKKMKTVKILRKKNNIRISKLLSEIYISGIYLEVKNRINDFTSFIQEKKGETVSSAESPFVLTVLRRWNSYTPILANHAYSKGGGYFIRVDGFGIVVDPGFDFIENFMQYDFKFHNIDYVLITHNHNDHTADIESLLTLLHQYNDAILGEYESPETGTIMYEVLQEVSGDINNKNISEYEDKVEVLTKNKAKKRFSEMRTRRKRIKFFMTVSTYNKFVTMTKLERETEYDIDIIKAGVPLEIECHTHKEGDKEVKNLTVTPIEAKHKDMASDRDCVGFVFKYDNVEKDKNGKEKCKKDKGGKEACERFALIYTGDTGFNKKIEDKYKEYMDAFVPREKFKVILLAHLGGFKPFENKFNPFNDDFSPPKGLDKDQFNERYFYPNHLGRIGLARLVEVVKPDICLVSEFGEEFARTRRRLIKAYDDVYYDENNKKTKFFAVDIGFKMNAESKIYAIEEADEEDGKLARGYYGWEEIEVCERRIDTSLHYYRAYKVDESDKKKKIALLDEAQVTDVLYREYISKINMS